MKKETSKRLRSPGVALFMGRSKDSPLRSLTGAMGRVAKQPVEAGFFRAGNGFAEQVFGVSPLSMRDHESITDEKCLALMERVNSLEVKMPNLEVYAESMRKLSELEAKKHSLISSTLSHVTAEAKAAQAAIQKADVEIAKILSAAGIDRQKYEQNMIANGQSARVQFEENVRSFSDRLRAIKDGVQDRERAQAVSEVRRQIGRGDAQIRSFVAGKGDTVAAMDALRSRPELLEELERARGSKSKSTSGGILVRMVKKAFS